MGLSTLSQDFLHERHVHYLSKALRRVPQALPAELVDVHRLSFFYFVVSGLDLLNALKSTISEDERKKMADWIYMYQVDSSKAKLGYAGFRGTQITGNGLPVDTGFITMTYCALISLCILNDDLSRVDRTSIIKSLRHCQNKDGSFNLSVLGGENDMRIVYCAVAISYILNDWSGIDVDSCVNFITDSMSYEGGFAQCPGAEAHGGSTYCAVASLKLLSKFDKVLDSDQVQRLTRWCLNRFEAGFNGRPNKEQDTCYSFWIGACLVMLDHYKFIEQDGLVEFVLQAQEESGGLCKVPAFYPDPMHTHLGIAGLTFVENSIQNAHKIELKTLDPLLNISHQSRKHLSNLHSTTLAEPIL